MAYAYTIIQSAEHADLFGINEWTTLPMAERHAKLSLMRLMTSDV